MKRQYRFLLLATLLLLCTVLCAHAEDAVELPTGEGPASGVYHVVNRADGSYLNTFNIAYAKDGYAYVGKRAKEEGEDILLLRDEDGTYRIYPQSEGGIYAFCVKDTAVGSRVCKSDQLTDGSHFRITADGDDFVIATADGSTVFGISKDDQLYKQRIVCLETYTGADVQRWTMEPVGVYSLELKTVTSPVKLYSVGAVYALVSPSYLKNFVEWSCDDESVLLLDDDGSFCALSVGTATVTATVGGYTASIQVTVTDAEAFTWYSQHLAENGGWHGTELSKVYFYAGAYKRFIVNGFNRNLDWMDEGCAVTSAAMVLHNLGALYKDGYDFRFEADGNLEADPYTIALANTGNTGLRQNSGTLYYNPIMMNLRAITKHFTLYGQKLETTTKYGVSKQSLKEQLDEHPEGVIVYMQNTYNGSHYIVVTECVNPDAAPADYQFIIYDPAGLKGYDGNHVLFEKSISYVTMRYRFYQMIATIVFEFKPEES